MKTFIILFSTVILAQCRPQQQQGAAGSPLASVEVAKQTVVELPPNARKLPDPPKTAQRKIEANTQEILDKIAEVNRKQGLTQKRSKPSFFHFPLSYSRKNDDDNYQRQSSSFRFPTNPYSNPIFDYLDAENGYSSNTRSAAPAQQVPIYSYTNPNAEVTKDDLIPGHYIKRKITHQQTVLVPISQLYPPGYQQMPSAPLPDTSLPQIDQFNSTMNSDIQNLEEQTIDNIKNIVSNSQIVNPYNSPYNQAQYNPYGQTYNNYQLYGPYVVPNYESRPARQWNWPGSQYFPIVIRDPFTHMMNAITTMVEYGPSGAGGNVAGCKKPKGEELRRSPKIVEGSEELNTVQGKGKDVMRLTFDDIEDLQIANDDDDVPLQFLINFKGSRKTSHEEESQESRTLDTSREATKVNSTLFRQQIGSKLEKIEHMSPSKLKHFENPFYRQTLPAREPNPSVIDEAEKEAEEPEDERAEDISIHNDGTRKVFTKENTGSGIFIHRLKVRKGGVAIAGPGGIATAGSGGTAIVGPNGVAYTHPDSLAIAGSGTKVIAVDPMISLSDIVANSTLLNNRTRTGIPSSRVGKVVAVGPVIYYNKG